MNEPFEKWCQRTILIPKYYAPRWGGAFHEVDLHDGALAKTLDQNGIDKIFETSRGLVGISQRVQRRAFAAKRTLTIRDKRQWGDGRTTKTEYDRIQNIALDGQPISVHWVHVFMNGDDTEATTDVYEGIITKRGFERWVVEQLERSDHPSGWGYVPTRWRPNYFNPSIESREWFWAIPFDQIVSNDMVVKVIGERVQHRLL